MKRNKLLYPITLGLFDGGAAAGGAGAGAAAGASGGGDAGTATGDTTNAGSASTRRGKSGEYANVVFGKAPAGEDSGTGGGAQQTQPHAAGDGNSKGEDLSKEFRDLVNGKYKDAYAAEVQRIINRRFGEDKTKDAQLAAQQPIIDTLMRRYGITDGDVSKLSSAIDGDEAMSDVLFGREAEAHGMSVPQYREYVRIQQENESLRREEAARRQEQRANEQFNDWIRQATEVASVYPEFDLQAELKNNPRFIAMLRSGVPVRHAYEVSHLDDILAGTARNASAAAEKRVTDNIRAKGMRPTENGTISQPGSVRKDDPSKWTKADRAEVIRRVARGEKITL